MVELPCTAPNCLGLILGATASRTHLQMKCSSTLLMTGVRDTGLKSDSICVGGFFLGRGITWADLHKSETYPCLMELLKTAHSGLARKGAKSRSTQVGISSGPVAFPGLRQASLLSTSSTVMTYLSGTLHSAERNGESAVRGGRCAATDWKKSLILSATSLMLPSLVDLASGSSAAAESLFPPRRHLIVRHQLEESAGSSRVSATEKVYSHARGNASVESRNSLGRR